MDLPPPYENYRKYKVLVDGFRYEPKVAAQSRGKAGLKGTEAQLYLYRYASDALARACAANKYDDPPIPCSLLDRGRMLRTMWLEAQEYAQTGRFAPGQEGGMLGGEKRIVGSRTIDRALRELGVGPV
eukprot:gene9267-3297_t